MDTLTHVLSGALGARAARPGGRNPVGPAECMLLGALAAGFPDSDVVISYLSPLAYLYNHRGVTHSFVLLPFWALLIAWIWTWLRGKPENFRTYLLIAFVGIFVHILGDLITSFGTMIFAPFSDARVEWGTTFIIDPWFTGIIVVALVMAIVFRGSRLPAVIGLAVLVGYVGFQRVQHNHAVAIGEAYAREQGLASARVSALPRPVSPLNWMVIVAEPERYHYTFVNLRRTQVARLADDAGFIARLDVHYLPVAAARWEQVARYGEGEDGVLGREAWAQRAFSFFRWFSAYPLVAAVQRGNPSQCVWFQDLRFLTPGRDAWPFRYGMCRGETGWQAYEYAVDGRHILVTED